MPAATRSKKTPAGETATAGDDFFRFLFERSGDATLLIDSRSLLFVDCNQATLTMLAAASKPEVLNLPPWELSPEFQPDGRRSLEKAHAMLDLGIREGTHRFEWVHRRRDGRDFPVEVTLTSIQIGDRPLVVTIWRDITERKATELALQESENKFRLLFESSTDGIQLIDTKTARFVDCNEATVRMLGARSKSEVLEKHPWELSPERQPDGRLSSDLANEIVATVIGRGTHRFEWTHRRMDGSEFLVEVVGSAVELGGKSHLVSVWRDIGERKKMERALRESENKFRLLFERSADPMLLLDLRSWRFIDCNDAAVALMRCDSKAELVSLQPWELSPERQPTGMSSEEQAQQNLDLLRTRGSARFEWVHRRLDGSEFPVEITLTKIEELEDQPLAFVIWREISERKQAERALRESENKFRLLFEHSPDAATLFDTRTGCFTQCNEAALRLLRADREWIIGQAPWELAPAFQPDGTPSREKAKEAIERINRTGAARFEWQHARGDGTDFPAEISITALELSEQPLWMAVIRDMTEWKLSQQAAEQANQSLERRVAERTAALIAAQEVLRRNEERFRLSFTHTADPIILMDVETSRFVEANDAAVRFYGAADMEQLLRAQPWDVSPERQHDGRLSDDAARENIEQVKARGAHRFEWTHRRFDGTEFPAEVSLTVVQFSDRPLMVAVLRDITERKLAEAELLRNLAKQKELTDLKSSFVSMVSHEFRTPLAVILSSAELLQNHLDRLPPPVREEQLRAIGTSTKQMCKMIDEVLLLGKVEGGQMRFAPAPLELGEFCARLVDEMHSATQRCCPIELVAPPDKESAIGDESLLRHILGNLLSNAVKYSPRGEPVRLEIERDGKHAILSVADHGVGIPAADLPKIFQAFQRAGNVGQIAGTGLGLVIVQRCVELHGGTIDLQSEAGKGTRVTVRLPLYAAGKRPTRAKPTAAKKRK